MNPGITIINFVHTAIAPPVRVVLSFLLIVAFLVKLLLLIVRVLILLLLRSWMFVQIFICIILITYFIMMSIKSFSFVMI